MIKLSEKSRDKLIDIIKMLLDGIENNNLALIDTKLLDPFSIKLIIDELFILELSDEVHLTSVLTAPTDAGSYFIRNFSRDLYKNKAALQRLLKSLDGKTSQQRVSEKDTKSNGQSKVTIIRTGNTIRCIIEGIEIRLDKTLNDNQRTELFHKLIDSRVPISIEDIARMFTGKSGELTQHDKNIAYGVIKDLRHDLGLKKSSPDNFIITENGTCFLSDTIIVK